jgi:hypothetical protein
MDAAYLGTRGRILHMLDSHTGNNNASATARRACRRPARSRR